QVERLTVKDVGRVHDRMRSAIGPVARGQGAADLTGTDGIDQHAVAADQVEDGEVRVRLLRVSNRVERLEVPDSLDDRGGVVDVRGGPELGGEVADGDPGYGRP